MAEGEVDGGGDGDPAGVLAFGFGEKDVGDNAIAEEDQEHRAEEFTGMGDTLRVLGQRGPAVE